MKNVLNCRENEAFVLILWRRRDRISLPLRYGCALCVVRDETVKKNEEAKISMIVIKLYPSKTNGDLQEKSSYLKHFP